MDAYVKLLIQTCHKRGVHAMGGMAAQIPIKNDKAANDKAMEGVRADKLREVCNNNTLRMIDLTIIRFLLATMVPGSHIQLLHQSLQKSSTSTCQHQINSSSADLKSTLVPTTS